MTRKIEVQQDLLHLSGAALVGAVQVLADMQGCKVNPDGSITDSQGNIWAIRKDEPSAGDQMSLAKALADELRQESHIARVLRQFKGH